MRFSTLGVMLGGSILFAFGAMSGCGSGTNSSTFDGGNGSGGDDGNASTSSSGGFTSSGGEGGTGGTASSSGGTGGQCPTGLMCNVRCPTGSTTTISGTVYDPAKKNPLYGITVYVPSGPLEALPSGLLPMPDACSCAALYKSGAVVSTTTDASGHFVLKDAPVGSNVQLVLQVGKWRHVVTIPTVSQCVDNPQQDKSLFLNGTVASGSMDSLPEIAVSTGYADTLECLMKRIGIDDSEYVAGANTGGHIHVFSGGQPPPVLIATDQSNPGNQELTPMPNAPASSTSLWDTEQHLSAYDILLLSCEGGETYNANPSVLEQYLNAGGRAFASHYHYEWFSGSLASNQNITAPSDWGPHLATWEDKTALPNGPDPGTIVTQLTGGGSFPKGQILASWLANVHALGINAPTGEVSLFQPRYNAVVGASNPASQPWITTQPEADSGVTQTQTMYFSFDTPVGGIPADGGVSYCGRSVFSDLHVSDDPSNMDTPNGSCDGIDPNGTGGCADAGPPDQPPPAGCAMTDLAPQEKVLEFMLFDLASCVVPDDVNPPTSIPINY